MTDIVERLREELASLGAAKLCDEERILGQEAEIERLRAAYKDLESRHEHNRGSLANANAEIERLQGLLDGWRRLA